LLILKQREACPLFWQVFFTGTVAPRFAWEQRKRSTPQNELEAGDCLGILREATNRAPFDRT